MPRIDPRAGPLHIDYVPGRSGFVLQAASVSFIGEYATIRLASGAIYMQTPVSMLLDWLERLEQAHPGSVRQPRRPEGCPER